MERSEKPLFFRTTGIIEENTLRDDLRKEKIDQGDAILQVETKGEMDGTSPTHDPNEHVAKSLLRKDGVDLPEKNDQFNEEGRDEEMSSQHVPDEQDMESSVKKDKDKDKVKKIKRIRITKTIISPNRAKSSSNLGSEMKFHSQTRRFVPITAKSSLSISSYEAEPVPAVFHMLQKLYAQSDVTIQQQRLNAWLDTFYQQYQLPESKQQTVFYEVDKWAGMGNMFRGYFSSLAIAVSTGRIVRSRMSYSQHNSFIVSSPSHYVSQCFFSPFPGNTYSM